MYSREMYKRVFREGGGEEGGRQRQRQRQTQTDKEGEREI